MIMKTADITGASFGKYKVIRFYGKGSHSAQLWECLCSCGTIKVVSGYSLRSGKSKSCGCSRQEYRMPKIIKHGGFRNGKATPEYSSWISMKDRCCSPNHAAYHRYGGRGIKVCERWIHSFENFLIDMGARPIIGTLDRIDSNGNYEPSNCRWATRKEQARNRESNILITHNSETKTLQEWSEIFPISAGSISKRLKRGLSVHDALTKPRSKNQFSDPMQRSHQF